MSLLLISPLGVLPVLNLAHIVVPVEFWIGLGLCTRCHVNKITRQILSQRLQTRVSNLMLQDEKLWKLHLYQEDFLNKIQQRDA